MKTRTMTIAALLLTAGCVSTTDRLNLAPLRTVERVDLERYLGTWYELASFPQSFQKGCTGSTATYALRPDGTIDVVNKCRLESLTGREKVAQGTARVVDTQTNARLQVSFFGPFWGDYWVIDLGSSYEYAVVGHPGRDYLWILSRTPQLDEAVYAGILERLQAAQYDLSRLQKTVQPVSPPQAAR